MELDDLLDALPRGWEGLAREMWEIVQSYDPPVRVVDAKSKWGELRYALDHREWETRREVYREASRRLGEIRERSITICEECAEPAADAPPGASVWTRTLCATHRRERE